MHIVTAGTKLMLDFTSASALDSGTWSLQQPHRVTALPETDRRSRASRVGIHGPTERTLRQRYKELELSYNALLRNLKLAEEVQRCLLPRELPIVDGVDFGAALRPTEHMTGDFYNVFRLDRDRVGFYVGDAMGHGPAAALMGVYTMLTLKTKRIQGQAYEIIEPGAALACLNDEILDVEFVGFPFVTLAYGVLDIPRRTWTYCCGGHPHPMIARRDGAIEMLEPTAPLLGVMESGFEQRSVTLEPHDRLLLYSDGAQAADWGDHGSGVAGLASMIRVQDERPLQRILSDAIQAVSFPDQHADDVTLLAIELTK